MPLLLHDSTLEPLVKILQTVNTPEAVQLVNTLLGKFAEQAQARLDFENSIQAARSNYVDVSSNDLEIDDEPLLSVADNGVWIGAWVWVQTDD